MKKSGILCLGLCLLVSAFSTACAKQETISPTLSDLNRMIENGEIKAEEIEADASYKFWANNFVELESHSPFIVRARVLESETKLGKVSKLEVVKSYKGDISGEIVFCQVASDNPVKDGNECILFMEKQYAEGEGDPNWYQPSSGGRSIMLIDSGNIYTNDEGLIDKDLEDWLNDNGVSDGGKLEIKPLSPFDN